MKGLVLLACVLAVAIAAPAHARRYEPRALELGGVYPTCSWVPTTIAEIPDLAQSTPGMIHLNPALLRMPRPLQLFWYAHECAHQLHGINEGYADCWAIRMGRIEGWFQVQDFALLERTLSPHGDSQHLPAPQRSALLWRCFTIGAAQYAGPPPQGPGLASYAQAPWRDGYRRK